MMQLDVYLARPVLGTDTEKPMESDWLAFRPLRLASGKLWVLDPTLFEGEVITLPPGEYQVLAKVMDWADDRRVSRLRVITGPIDPVDGAVLGRQISEVGVDFAQVGVGDWERCTSSAEALDEASQNRIVAALDTMELYGVAYWDEHGQVPMPFVQSGFGDGTFPIYEILRDSVRVGVEVVFIDTEKGPSP
jgi:hypothetical protein